MGREPTFSFGRTVDNSGARLKELIRPAVEALGFELVGVVYRRGRERSLLRIYIDHDNGVMLDDCAAISHQVSGVMEVEDPIGGEYDLEVSSPGLDRPLFEAAHFDRFRGEQVRVRMLAPFEGAAQLQGSIRWF